MAKPRGAWVRTQADWFFDYGCVIGGRVSHNTDPFMFEAIGFFNNSTLGYIAHIYAIAGDSGPTNFDAAVIGGKLSSNLVSNGQRATSQGAAVDGQLYKLRQASAFTYTELLTFGNLDVYALAPGFPVFAVWPGQSLVFFNNDATTISTGITLWYLLYDRVNGEPH